MIKEPISYIDFLLAEAAHMYYPYFLLVADSSEVGTNPDFYLPVIPYKDEYFTHPDNRTKQENKQLILANGKKFKTSGKSVVVISNPFKAIYALYATSAGGIPYQNYNYQFFGTGKGNILSCCLSYAPMHG